MSSPGRLSASAPGARHHPQMLPLYKLRDYNRAAAEPNVSKGGGCGAGGARGLRATPALAEPEPVPAERGAGPVGRLLGALAPVRRLGELATRVYGRHPGELRSGARSPGGVAGNLSGKRAPRARGQGEQGGEDSPALRMSREDARGAPPEAQGIR